MRRSMRPIAMSCRCCEGKYDWSACSLASGFWARAADRAARRHNGKFTCGGSETAYPTNYHQWRHRCGQHGRAGRCAVTRDRRSTTTARSITSSVRMSATRPVRFLHYDFNEHATVYDELHVHGRPHRRADRALGRFRHERTVQLRQPVPERRKSSGCCAAAAPPARPDPTILLRAPQRRRRRPRTKHRAQGFPRSAGRQGQDRRCVELRRELQLQPRQSEFATRSTISPRPSSTNALNVTGTARRPRACVSGPPCVPYNMFQPGGVTQAALNYLYTPGITVGRITQTDVIVNFTGDLEKYGVQSPTASSGSARSISAPNIGTPRSDVAR